MTLSAVARKHARLHRRRLNPASNLSQRPRNQFPGLDFFGSSYPFRSNWSANTILVHTGPKASKV